MADSQSAMGNAAGPVILIDTHTHLNHPRLARRLDDVLTRARDAGVRQMIVVGYDLPSSEAAVALAQHYPALWAAVGVHPHYADSMDEEAVDQLRSLAGSKRVVAVGETGLDFFRDLSPRDAQERAFRRQLALAAEFGLPGLVHCRGAHQRLLAVLREHANRGPNLVWHCFDGNAEQAAEAVALGMAVGFTGIVTYADSHELRRAAAEVPLDRVLLETDCPYLMPEPRSKGDNEPANLPVIAACVAKVMGMSVDDLARAATANARRTFRLSAE